MSDRHEQARAEAERQIHVYGDDFKARTLRANLNDAFVQGVAWADANPQPRTITHDDMGAAYAAFMGAEGHPVRRFIVALKAAGVEVEADDE